MLFLIGAWLGYAKLEDNVVLATSFMGSFIMWKGVGLLARGFPNEYVLISYILRGYYNTVNASWYGYLAAILVWTAIAFYAQGAVKKREQQMANGQLVSVHGYVQLQGGPQPGAVKMGGGCGGGSAMRAADPEIQYVQPQYVQMQVSPSQAKKGGCGSSSQAQPQVQYVQVQPQFMAP